MTQLLLLALTLALAGCSTRPQVTAVPPAVQITVPSAAEIEVIEPESAIAAPAPAPFVNTVVDAIKSGQVTIDKVKKVATSVKAAVAAVKEVKAQVDTFNPDTVQESPVPVPADPRPTMPVAPPYDSRTGAKIQFLGIDLEFWLGQNDSWSTVFKMLTLLIATYGGFRGINFLFSKKSTAV